MNLNGVQITEHPLAEHSEHAPVRRFRVGRSEVLAAIATDFGTITVRNGVIHFGPGDYIVSDDPPTYAWAVKKEVFEESHVEI